MTLWGTGTPRREFLYSDDMAAACVHLMTLPEDRLATVVNDAKPPLVNVGCGVDLTIRELAELVRKIVGADVAIEWDHEAGRHAAEAPRREQAVGARLAREHRSRRRNPAGVRRLSATLSAVTGLGRLEGVESGDSHMLRDAVPVRPSNVSK